jgi:hypothetical protein
MWRAARSLEGRIHYPLLKVYLKHTRQARTWWGEQIGYPEKSSRSSQVRTRFALRLEVNGRVITSIALVDWEEPTLLLVIHAGRRGFGIFPIPWWLFTKYKYCGRRSPLFPLSSNQRLETMPGFKRSSSFQLQFVVEKWKSRFLLLVVV